MKKATEPKSPVPDAKSSKVGYALIEEALGRNARRALPLTTQLFPYIFEASSHMSARAISAWLKEKQGIGLSSVSISRALTQPKLHWRRIASHAVRWAKIVAPVLDMHPIQLLTDGAVINPEDKMELAEGDKWIQDAMRKEEISPSQSKTVFAAASNLREHFFCLPGDAMQACLNTLTEKGGDENDQEDEDHED